MKKLVTVTLSFFLFAGMTFADGRKDANGPPAEPAKPEAAKKNSEPTVASFEAELEELRHRVESQQEELQLLREQLAKRDRQGGQAPEAAAANAHAAEPSVKANEAAPFSAKTESSAGLLSPNVNGAKTSADARKSAEASGAGQAKSEEGPASIKFKGVTITPGGFLAAESVWRQRSTQGDVNTPFTGIPFPNNALSRVSEFNASGRQSRLSFLFEGKADKVAFTGYYELDWLGACVTSNNRQSNSYCMRQRQIWGQAAIPGGWAFTGGQMWSLATETKSGLNNRTEALPMTIDAQYSVGFTWARQYGFRVTKNFNNKAWFGVSVEGPQTTFGGRGSPTQFFVGGAGAGGGLLNFVDTTGYSLNKTPDFILKAAFEPGWGHYEVFGVISPFRARVYPCSAPVAMVALPANCPGVAPSAANAFNDTRTGGGIGVNLRAPIVAKKVDAGLHFFGGDGVGRYSSAQLADVTARPNGTLALVRGGSALGTLEVHPSPKLDVYFNYGIEVADRAAYSFVPAAGGAAVPVGYGSALFNNSGCENAEGLPTAPFTPNTGNGTCNGDLRNIQEGTVGFWHQAYKGSKGGIRWGLQYSYLLKNTWSGNNNTPTVPGINGKAVDNMLLTSFRYYIP